MYLELLFVVCRFFLALLRSREERREYGDERRDKDGEVRRGSAYRFNELLVSSVVSGVVAGAVSGVVSSIAGVADDVVDGVCVVSGIDDGLGECAVPAGGARRESGILRGVVQNRRSSLRSGRFLKFCESNRRFAIR